MVREPHASIDREGESKPVGAAIHQTVNYNITQINNTSAAPSQFKLMEALLSFDGSLLQQSSTFIQTILEKQKSKSIVIQDVEHKLAEQLTFSKTLRDAIKPI